MGRARGKIGAARASRSRSRDPFIPTFGATRGSGRLDPVGDAALHREIDETTGAIRYYREPVTKELPMEYAVELNRLIQLEMVGSIG